MNRIVLFLFLFSFFGISTTSRAGGFRFPNVEFSSAKLYYFNVGIKPQKMYMHIYKDGVYAPTKLGYGKKLDDDFHKKVQKVFAQGMDELYYGLGKCYFPRHGIIYYDENDTPVASMSICFECDRVMVWSTKSLSFDDNARNFKRAEQQIERLLKIIKNEDIIAGKSREYESKYMESIRKDFTATEPILQEFTVSHPIHSVFPNFHQVNAEKINTFIIPSRKKGKLFEVKKDTSAYSVYRFYRESSFRFDTDGVLVDLTVVDPEVLLLDEVKIGMSHLEIMTKDTNRLQEKDWKKGGDYPTELTINYTDYTLSLSFQLGTLIKIVAVRN